MIYCPVIVWHALNTILVGLAGLQEWRLSPLVWARQPVGAASIYQLGVLGHLDPNILGLMIGLGLASLVICVLLVEVLRCRSFQAQLLQENEKRSHDLATLGADLFWELDEDLKFSYLSGNFHYFQRDDLVGKTPYQALVNHSKLEADWDYLQERLTQYQPLENFTLRLQTSDTTLRIFKLNARPLFDQHHRFQGYRGLQREVTEEYNLTQTIAYQATYDPLTGLINRNEFDTRLRQAIKRVQERGMQSVLGYLDLDQFKIVNDTAGHLVGDQLLAELAQLLQQNIRSSDSLGRLGGDEFGLLLEGCSLEQGQQLSQTLVDKISSYQFMWQGRQFQVGVSIGLVPILADVSNVLELLSRADLACYKAKDLGRSRVYLADKNDTELDRQHLELVHIANIPQAIEENRFYLMEQPIISLWDDSHSHVEILLRLTDEAGNIVHPHLFIPMAERYGMIGLIDRWVVKTVLTNYHRYYPEAQTIVAINLSGSSLSDERFTEFVTQLLQQSAMPADRLCFEITETTTISQLDQALKFITTIKELGVTFALDDFGSGVSSFGYLRQLPVDYLKIDGDLIRSIETEDYIPTIVDMVNQVATMMGMKTIAEFVENDLILDRLRELNVGYVQGYGIGKPKPLPRFDA
ncbi:EAL domain-containing protein [Leptothoe sp. PORK10 BA2]|uniref:EAL domain-containing protein n=1 Tax=Leptothoe sp. PORK10 BA2 TaxID=3110254 RepID=UPI002B1F31A6|nr:EAL domain-containing protein [Leptothoe sp. PORK10 BA2]MEA5463067.1 EAL domain-containing protein [Leptothoe sp. PORK10 BA2]